MNSREQNGSAESRRDWEEKKSDRLPQAAQSNKKQEEESASREMDSEWLTTTTYKSQIVRNPGPRIWILPTVMGNWFSVPEETDTSVLASGFANSHPVLLAPKINADECQTASVQAQEATNRQILEVSHEALFKFISRVIVSMAWIVLAGGGLALPGEVRFLDGLLLGVGSAFFVYTLIRYGLPVLRWHNWRVDARNSFGHVRWVRNKLIERLLQALEFRKKLPPDERGQSPDDELLDANAYKKLIKEGVTTMSELSVLGTALEARLKLNDPDSRTGEAARCARVDVDSLLFYRDLAQAANELRSDPEYL